MFIFCRNIGLSIYNILSVLLTKKIKKNYFYGHSISGMRHRGMQKMKQIK